MAAFYSPCNKPMSSTGRILIENGIWYGGYEPHDMPGAWARWRYKLTPTDNGGMIANGWHEGQLYGEKLLGIRFGGEYFNGAMINQQIRDFFAEFDDEYHDEYYAGLKRGYQGRRRCHGDYLHSRSQQWRDGYQEGLRVKQERLVTA